MPCRSFTNRPSANTRDCVLVTHETLVLSLLIVLALISRFAHLSDFPLQPREIPNAITPIRIPNEVSTDVTGASPLLYGLYRLLYAMFGVDAEILRLPMAVAGVGLIFFPLLFRQLIGRAECLILSGLLLISPLFLFASRSAESSILAQVGCIGMLYSLYRCWLAVSGSRARYQWQLVFAFSIVITVFLTDGRGYLLAGSAILAALFSTRGGLQINDEIKELFREWPWRHSLLVGIGSVFFLSTGFLTQLDGLTLVGNNLASALAGWTSPGNFLQVIPISLFYEYGFWLIAIIPLLTRWKQETVSYYEKFAATWLAILIIFLTIDRSANPIHASWLSIPLTVWVLVALKPLFNRHRTSFNGKQLFSEPQAYWLLGITYGLLLIWMVVQSRILMNQTSFSSYISNILSGHSSYLSPESVWVILRLSVGLLLFAALYLGAQLYIEKRIVKRAIGAAAACILLATTMSSGLHTISNPDSLSMSPWLPLTNTNAKDYFSQSLEEAAYQLSNREEKPTIALALNQESNLAQLNTLFWHLRDYRKVKVLPTLEVASGYPIIISDAITEEEAENRLDGNYIGQHFVLSRYGELGRPGTQFLPPLFRNTKSVSIETTDSASLNIILWVSSKVIDYDHSPN